MENSLKNLINYLQDNVIDLNDDNEISETLVKYIENDKNYCEKIKNIINSHKDDDWEGAEFVDEFNDDFGIELPNYDVLDAMETNEIPNEFAINIVSPDECFKTLNITLKDNNGALEIEDKTPGSQINIKNNQDNDMRLADYYYDLGVKTGQKMYFEMAKRLKDQANMQALNDLLKRAENTPDDEDGENIDTSDIDKDNKFVMEVITKDYICNGEGYWGKDDWDDLVKDGNILCYIYDADEEPIPDFSPDWLYKILGKYENIPGGYCLEDMESTFIVSKETYDALAKDPHCDSADDYTECGYNYNEDDENIDNNDGNHSFRILKYSKAQRKRNEETNPGMIYPDRELAYIFDASEQFLPDHTPDWLYDIMNSVDQYGWDELMESIFDVSPEFLDKLSKHPQCIEYRECTNKEAGFDESNNETTKPKLPKCKTETMNKVIDLIYDHYGFTRMELYWEISLKQHYLTVRDIYYNPIIYIYKDTPNLIYVDNYMHTAPIDINKAGWEKKLIIKLDAIIKREKRIDQELEKNGFNNALRRAGLYDIFH